MPGKLASSGDVPPAIMVDNAPSGEPPPFMFMFFEPGEPPTWMGGLDSSPTPSKKPSMPPMPPWNGERGAAPRLLPPASMPALWPPVLNMEPAPPGPYQLLVPRPNGDGAAPDAPVAPSGDIIEWSVASKTAAAAAAAAAGLTPYAVDPPARLAASAASSAALRLRPLGPAAARSALAAALASAACCLAIALASALDCFLAEAFSSLPAPPFFFLPSPSRGVSAAASASSPRARASSTLRLSVEFQ
mmetsp:Transcript_47604/g.114280  ORF Transcript_47604/g.114280 Transcript_47604/m.114280 type:complete len:246 (+) Transcript_47604:829-1566(+)